MERGLASAPPTKWSRHSCREDVGSMLDAGSDQVSESCASDGGQHCISKSKQEKSSVFLRCNAGRLSCTSVGSKHGNLRQAYDRTTCPKEPLPSGFNTLAGAKPWRLGVLIPLSVIPVIPVIRNFGTARQVPRSGTRCGRA